MCILEMMYDSISLGPYCMQRLVLLLNFILLEHSSNTKKLTKILIPLMAASRLTNSLVSTWQSSEREFGLNLIGS